MSAQPAASPSKSPFPLAPPPWQCKCDVYWVLFRTGGQLPANAYAPLEASSEAFANSAQAGAFKGGQGLVMILRYKETPLGPYNEMVYIPGSFEVPGQGRNGSRVTKIFVDQKETTYNGRLNWNLPKQVVRFVFSELSNPAHIKVEVFPPDSGITTPFFTATFQPLRWTPSFPFSSKPFIIQPPVPASTKAGEEELVGTEKWAQTLTVLACKKAKLCRVNVEQPSSEKDDEKLLASWWPKVNAWKIGLCLEGSTFDLGPGEQF